LLVPILIISQKDIWNVLSGLSLREWFIFLFSGILGSTIQLGLLFWGLNYTTSLDASVIGAIPPVLVAIGAVLFLHEKVNRFQALGLILAFFGSILIVVQPVLEGQSFFSGSIFGNFLVFLGAVSWAIYVLLTKHELKQKLSPLLLTTNMFFSGLISISLILIFRYRPYAIGSMLIHASLNSHLAVIYMAYLSGALAYYLYQISQKTVSATQANIFLYLSPVFTAPLAYLWLGEPITLTLVIGCGIIALGVLLAELRR
jgi:drug/metabolite transporter (DMT)-like permease